MYMYVWAGSNRKMTVFLFTRDIVSISAQSVAPTSPPKNGGRPGIFSHVSDDQGRIKGDRNVRRQAQLQFSDTEERQ